MATTARATATPVATRAATAAPAPGPSRGSIIGAFGAVYVIWGSTYLAIRWVLESLPPFISGGARFLLAGAVLMAWAWWSEGRRPEGRERVGLAQWKWSAVIGGLLFLGGNGAVMWAETRVASSVAALLVAFMPCCLVLLEWLGPTRKVPSLLTVAGLLTGTAGLVLLVGMPGTTSAGHGRGVDLLGAGVLLLGSFTWAAGSLVARGAPLAKSHVRNSAMQMITGGALLVLAGLAAGETSALAHAQVTRASLLAWLYLVIFGSLVAFTAFAFLMRTVSAAKVATYAYVNPVVAVLLGWALASEPVTARMLVAAAIIVGAVVMITRGKS